MSYPLNSRHDAFLRSWYRSKHYTAAVAFARKERAEHGCVCAGELVVRQHETSCPENPAHSTDATR